MEKRTSAVARIIAALALVAAVIAVVVVISAADPEDASHKERHRSGQSAQQDERPRTKAKSYVVKSGDTLIAISHRTGVPVAEILVLNPEVDPQLLQAGETLKLR